MASAFPFEYVVCVDWGKTQAKRRAWVADVARATVRPLEMKKVTVDSLLSAAKGLGGKVLIGVDAALGIPLRYFELRHKAPSRWQKARSFLEWLVAAQHAPHFFEENSIASEWTFDRPFIKVPKGNDALNAFWKKAGGPLQREIDTKTGAKSPFIVSGIPGSVGSGSRALWQELLPHLCKPRSVGLWPFDGTLFDLIRRNDVVLAEIYPRVCYGIALAEALPAPLLRIGKRKAHVRSRELAKLQQKNAWVRRAGVKIGEIAAARESEDDFDAMLSALALLRVLLEGHPLEGLSNAPEVEGGILTLSDRNVSFKKKAPKLAIRIASELPRSMNLRRFVCPIPDCKKVFMSSRGGWDAHVASIKTHPNWLPLEMASERRKAAFKTQFPEFFL